jgi:LPS sulfotransferase NodH
VEPVRSYVICCVQRTGSWLLAHTLADTGYAGPPSDYFDGAERENHTREWGMPPGDLARPEPVAWPGGASSPGPRTP